MRLRSNFMCCRLVASCLSEWPHVLPHSCHCARYVTATLRVCMQWYGAHGSGTAAHAQATVDSTVTQRTGSPGSCPSHRHCSSTLHACSDTAPSRGMLQLQPAARCAAAAVCRSSAALLYARAAAVTPPCRCTAPLHRTQPAALFHCSSLTAFTAHARAATTVASTATQSASATASDTGASPYTVAFTQQLLRDLQQFHSNSNTTTPLTPQLTCTQHYFIRDLIDTLERTNTTAAPALQGTPILLTGWIRSVRLSKHDRFVVLNDGTTFSSFQCIIASDTWKQAHKYAQHSHMPHSNDSAGANCSAAATDSQSFNTFTEQHVNTGAAIAVLGTIQFNPSYKQQQPQQSSMAAATAQSGSPSTPPAFTAQYQRYELLVQQLLVLGECDKVGCLMSTAAIAYVQCCLCMYAAYVTLIACSAFCCLCLL